MVTNALTIDVEDYFQVGVFQDRLPTAEWDAFAPRVERNLDLCLELIEKRGIKATFFVLGWVAERWPAAIRRLVESGHEVGSHGYGHQPVWKLTPEAFREDVHRAQGTIGDAIGAQPTSYRAPCFSVVERTLWALEILHDEGIRDDSSIFPVNHPEYGIPGAETAIHRIELPNGGVLREFPMTVGKVFGKQVAFCGGGYFRLLPYWVTRRFLRNAESTGRPFVFYLHPWELDPEQPRLDERATRFGRFRHYNNLERTESRFSQLLDDFAFAPMKSVLDEAEAAAALPRVAYRELLAT